MVKINRNLITPSIVILAILLISIYGASHVSAGNEINRSGLISKIAQKFNLKESEVAEVFEQERMEMWQEKQNQREVNLNKAVGDGVITEDQKNKLLEKMINWQAERFAQRVDHREEMQEWFTENGIDHEKLIPYMGRGGHGERMKKPPEIQ